MKTKNGYVKDGKINPRKNALYDYKKTNLFAFIFIMVIASFIAPSPVFGKNEKVKDVSTNVLKKSSKNSVENKLIRTEASYQKFTLVKGKGTEVCEAYLERLNKTWFERLPFCDRPDNTNLPGFEKLNRVNLTAEEIYPLYYGIDSFLSGNKKLNDESEKKSRVNGINKRNAINCIEKEIQNLDLSASRYDPPIDFDNDGKPDNLLLWKRYRCGSYEGGDPFPRHGQTIVLVLTPDSMAVDEANTKRLVGHPIGGFPTSDKKGFYKGFRPVGTSMGIFRYKGTTYFDTFFDSWGDFSGKRRKSPDISRTLGVFKREGQKTKQVCEYLWKIPYEGTFPESNEKPID
ncbi:MAG TPA: hypothetical protein PKM41_07645 [Deltaproteobacteria bacterium]|nr:hypothetical protein [Deltaproteobacteria bacterium]HOI06914.1 hypothetical protein [Deltaproteobacteria bacterium]